MWKKLRKVIIENFAAISFLFLSMCLALGLGWSIINSSSPVYKLDKSSWRCTNEIHAKVTYGDKTEYRNECLVYERYYQGRVSNKSDLDPS